MVTFPPMAVIQKAHDGALPYMEPSLLPFAIVMEGYLSDEECDWLLAEIHTIAPIKLGICDAITRECPFPLPDGYNPVLDCVRTLNSFYWKLDLHEDAAAFAQEYPRGGKYQLHIDGQVGQVRKLTAVALLTDPAKYGGGQLRLHYHPNELAVPKTRGTIVVFLSWMLHEVREVTWGTRETVNFGFWGPPFR